MVIQFHSLFAVIPSEPEYKVDLEALWELMSDRKVEVGREQFEDCRLASGEMPVEGRGHRHRSDIAYCFVD